MPGNYTLRRTYVDGDILSASDYVADHQQHIDNQTPQGTDDYSASVTQMRTITDTGDTNGESLASSLAGELERLRYQIKHIKEKVNGSAIANWYAKGYSVTVPNATITSAKLANGATFIQFIRTTASNVALNDTAEHTIVSQSITTSRTRVRIRLCFSGIDFTTAGGNTYTLRIKRGATTLATIAHSSIGTASAQDTVTFVEEFLDTTAVGTKTYSFTIQLANTDSINVANQSWMTLEEVA